MRKLKITLFISIALLAEFQLKAQSNWEIGGRFGNDFALDITIPFKAPRLHPAVYFDNNVWTGLYFDWLFALEHDPSGLKFYPGLGPELFFNNGLGLAVAGDFGMEYSFDFPLTIGIDWRPRLMITDNSGFNSKNWGIFARFRFGNGVKLVRSK